MDHARHSLLVGSLTEATDQLLPVALLQLSSHLNDHGYKQIIKYVFLFTSLCLRACLPLTPTQLTCNRKNLKHQILKNFFECFSPILKTTREAKSLCHKELFLLKNDQLETANSIRHSAKISKVRGMVKSQYPTRRLTSACVCICPQNISCKNFPKNLYLQYAYISFNISRICVKIQKYW